MTTTPHNTLDTPKVKRRDFLKMTWTALGGLAALEIGGLALAYMQPRLAEGESVDHRRSG
jgi:hypothetical protein